MSDIDLGLLQNAEKRIIVDQEQFTIELQKYYSGHNKNSKKLQWTSKRIQSVIKLLNDFNTAKSQGRRPTNQQYHHANKYDIMNVGSQNVLILKRKSILDPVVQIIPSEEFYQKILDAHLATGHGRRDKIVYAFRNKYVIPIFAITIFINMCKTCLSKKNFPKSGIVVKPLISEDFNRRGQVDLVDFQTSPDEEYRWLLQYQDHSTKFCFLRPLKTKRAKEVAIEILKIFLEVGCPHVLQSDNGREFTASVLKEIVSLWPSCKIVHERPRYPQSQESIEHSNQDLKNMIHAWMEDNQSKSWSIGCYFVQFQKNTSYHSTIARTPYKALFGVDPKLELSSTFLPKDIICKVETEEDVERVFEDIHNNEKQNSEKKSNLLPTIHETSVTNVTFNILNSEINMIKQEQDKIHENVNQEIVTSHIIDKAIISKNSNISPNIDEVVSEVLMCYICNKEASGAHTCMNCNNIIHKICGEVSEEDEGYGLQVLCNLCVNECNMIQVRKQLQIHLKREADKMIATSSKKFKGSSIIVEVPKVDKGPLNSKNQIGKVLDKKNELYRVDTAFGTIKNWLPRNDVLSSPRVTLPNDIPEIILPLRTIASMSSSFGGQGIKQCNCKTIKNGQCVSNKCNCKKANILCNSRCHSSLTCNNK